MTRVLTSITVKRAAMSKALENASEFFHKQLTRFFLVNLVIDWFEAEGRKRKAPQTPKVTNKKSNKKVPPVRIGKYIYLMS